MWQLWWRLILVASQGGLVVVQALSSQRPALWDAHAWPLPSPTLSRLKPSLASEMEQGGWGGAGALLPSPLCSCSLSCPLGGFPALCLVLAAASSCHLLCI